MAEINLATVSPEVLAAYQIANNAFARTEIKNAALDKTGAPKDAVRVVIGDDMDPTRFWPQVKVERWSNEVNFSLRLIDGESGQETVATNKDKIVWEHGNVVIENFSYLEGGGGYKFVWYLKKKPATNTVSFTMQSKGLEFYYQPELTAHELARGAQRPDHVVGSYAVYHATRGGATQGSGKDYRAGKAFHIYRPHVTDAVGAEAWGTVRIDNGVYTEEIPQAFLDTAVYPIRSNATLGFSEQGGSNATIGSLTIGVSYHATTDASGGTTSTLRAFTKNDSGTEYDLKIAIYTDDVGNNRPETKASEGLIVVPASSGVAERSVAYVEVLAASTKYWFGICSENATNPYLYYDAAAALTEHDCAITSYTLPATWPNAGSNYAYKYSVWAVYEAGAAAPRYILGSH